MKPKILGPKRLFFGTRRYDNADIYITKPSFDCDWYWGFGYLGNEDEHYHLSFYQRDPADYSRIRNINMRDALLQDYDLAPPIRTHLWTFCELTRSIYILKESAELFHRGGAQYAPNPLRDRLFDESLYEKLTFDLLPVLCQEFWNLVQGLNHYTVEGQE
jgi:hypothetical protein